MKTFLFAQKYKPNNTAALTRYQISQSLKNCGCKCSDITYTKYDKTQVDFYSAVKLKMSTKNSILKRFLEYNYCKLHLTATQLMIAFYIYETPCIKIGQ